MTNATEWQVGDRLYDPNNRRFSTIVSIEKNMIKFVIDKFKNDSLQDCNISIQVLRHYAYKNMTAIERELAELKEHDIYGMEND